MMGYQKNSQSKLFHYGLNLGKRVPQDHTLRKINARINFDFIYKEVKDAHSEKGNISVPPLVMLKDDASS